MGKFPYVNVSLVCFFFSKVLVEFDDAEWKKREWIRVYEEGAFRIFLVENTLVWTLRKQEPPSAALGGHPSTSSSGQAQSNASGSNKSSISSSKGLYWPALVSTFSRTYKWALEGVGGLKINGNLTGAFFIMTFYPKNKATCRKRSIGRIQ